MSGGKNYDSTTLENDLAAATRSNNSEDVACTAEDILAEIEEQIKATAAADQWDGEKKLAAPAMMYSSATRNSQPISQPISDLYGGTSSSGRLRQGGTRSGDGAIAAAAAAAADVNNDDGDDGGDDDNDDSIAAGDATASDAYGGGAGDCGSKVSIRPATPGSPVSASSPRTTVDRLIQETDTLLTESRLFSADVNIGVEDAHTFRGGRGDGQAQRGELKIELAEGSKGNGDDGETNLVSTKIYLAARTAMDMARTAICNGHPDSPARRAVLEQLDLAEQTQLSQLDALGCSPRKPTRKWLSENAERGGVGEDVGVPGSVYDEGGRDVFFAGFGCDSSRWGCLDEGQEKEEDAMVDGGGEPFRQNQAWHGDGGEHGGDVCIINPYYTPSKARPSISVGMLEDASAAYFNGFSDSEGESESGEYSSEGGEGEDRGR
jgi:hypothetical protein